jgi:phenylacetic acid degradation operon negative regulatory protein
VSQDAALREADERAARSTAQLLAALMGDYWYAGEDFIPSAALVTLLGEFGVGEAAARATLSRLTRAGNLEGTRTGRTTAYRLAPSMMEEAKSLSRALTLVGAEPIGWDGRWTCVAFSVPESDRHLRRALRRRLRALGLGPLFDGLWITPSAPLEGLDQALDELGIAEAVVLRVVDVPRPGVDLLGAWDLERLRSGYERLVKDLERIEARVEAGEMGSAEALVVRTRLAARWITLAARDPGLPDALLPADWPVREARRRYIAVYDALGPLSELRVRQLVAMHDEAAAKIPRHHRAEDIL